MSELITIMLIAAKSIWNIDGIWYKRKSNLIGIALTFSFNLWSIADSNRSPRHCQCRALAR